MTKSECIFMNMALNDIENMNYSYSYFENVQFKGTFNKVVFTGCKMVNCSFELDAESEGTIFNCYIINPKETSYGNMVIKNKSPKKGFIVTSKDIVVVVIPKDAKVTQLDKYLFITNKVKLMYTVIENEHFKGETEASDKDYLFTDDFIMAVDLLIRSNNPISA